MPLWHQSANLRNLYEKPTGESYIYTLFNIFPVTRVRPSAKVIKTPKTFCHLGKKLYLCSIVNTYPDIMANKKQIHRQEKSLPKETLVESIGGERHGAVAGNASAKNLNSSGSERLNHSALTHSYSAAKLQQNTETAKKKAQKLANNGYIIKSSASETDIVRNLSKALGIRKSDSSMSYYSYFRVDQTNIKFRLSTHPANGDRMSNDKMDMGISVLVYKNGLHSSDGTIPWKEFRYELKTTTATEIIRSIVDGLSSLLAGKGFVDHLGISVETDYNFFGSQP